MASLLDQLVTDKARGELAVNSNNYSLIWGKVVGIDYENYTMIVEIPSGSGVDKVTTRINESFTDTGYGVRFYPTINRTLVILFRLSRDKYIHIGYMYDGTLQNYISDKSNEKANSTDGLMLRYIDSGEVQIVGITRNEIYLSNDGSVFLKAQYGAFLKLDNLMHRLEGVFANMKFEMDGVRIRAGNTIRPVIDKTYEEDYILIKDEEIIKESSIPESQDYTEIEPIREFFVQVGTSVSENGIDEDQPLSPSVGYLAIADRIVNEKGEEIKVLDKSLNFRLKLMKGTSIAIDTEGSMYVLDDLNGNFTKFGNGTDPDKSMRAKDNMILLNSTDGVYLKHESGSLIHMTPGGDININDANENAVHMQSNGITLNSPNGDIVLRGNRIVLAPDDNIVVGNPNNAADLVITAGGLAAIFDAHTHTGPTGPTNPLNHLSVPANAQIAAVKGMIST